MTTANCNEPLRLLRGPQGAAGAAGANGTNGSNAFTTTSANFTVPALGADVTVEVGSTAWMSPTGTGISGQIVHIQNAGHFIVKAVVDATHVTLTNPGTGYTNAAPATVIAAGSKVSPAGLQGLAGTSGGAGTGVTVAAKGDIQTFAGAPASLPVGTDGQILRALSAAATGLDWETLIPLASGTTDNQLPRLDSPLGTETPAALQTSSMKLTDNGALQHTGGNAKGTDAVDLQASRTLATQVASGNYSVVAGGQNNKATFAQAVVSGGVDNTASQIAAACGGGSANTASGAASVVGGGQNNVSSGSASAVGGGDTNVANNALATVAGGDSNTASGNSSTVGGGSGNAASALYAAVPGGRSNTASGTAAAVLGSTNTGSGSYSSVPGGLEASANKYGQLSHASGKFAAAGDAQASELIWRRLTTDATANQEMFLDGAGATQRATVPNNTTWGFQILLAARRDDGTSFIYKAEGGIKNTAGVVALVAAITEAVVADGTGGALAVANVDVDADAANVSLRPRVTGIAGQAWRWVAWGRIVEVSH